MQELTHLQKHEQDILTVFENAVELGEIQIQMRDEAQAKSQRARIYALTRRFKTETATGKADWAKWLSIMGEVSLYVQGNVLVFREKRLDPANLAFAQGIESLGLRPAQVKTLSSELNSMAARLAEAQAEVDRAAAPSASPDAATAPSSAFSFPEPDSEELGKRTGKYY